MKPQRLQGRRGFTRQPENSKRAYLRVPAFKNTTKIQREDPREREKERKWGREREKKREILGGPAEGGKAEGGSGGGNEKKNKNLSI